MLPVWQFHWDVWLVVVVLGIGYWHAERRLRPLVAPASEPATRRQWFRWYLGLGLLWFASDWPVHDLAEEVLFSAHMIEHLLIGAVVPRLFLTGMPGWMADATLGRAARVLRPVATPVVGFVTFNVMLILVHWPAAVALQNTNELAHFGMHLALFASGILLWLPVVSPTAAIPVVSAPAAMLYLLANTLLPTVPASFLTFGHHPIYTVYGDAATTWGLSPLADQNIAGIVMKVVGGFYLLAIVLGIWLRYNRDERRWDEIERELTDSR